MRQNESSYNHLPSFASPDGNVPSGMPGKTPLDHTNHFYNRETNRNMLKDLAPESHCGFAKTKIASYLILEVIKKTLHRRQRSPQIKNVFLETKERSISFNVMPNTLKSATLPGPLTVARY